MSMTPDEMQVAVCEALGWKLLEPEVHPAITYDWALSPSGEKRILPDLTLDLLHEAEKKLKTKEQRNAYVNALFDLVEAESQPDQDFEWCTASAEQRAEALLKILKP